MGRFKTEAARALRRLAKINAMQEELKDPKPVARVPNGWRNNAKNRRMFTAFVKAKEKAKKAK